MSSGEPIINNNNNNNSKRAILLGNDVFGVDLLTRNLCVSMCLLQLTLAQKSTSIIPTTSSIMISPTRSALIVFVSMFAYLLLFILFVNLFVYCFVYLFICLLRLHFFFPGRGSNARASPPPEIAFEYLTFISPQFWTEQICNHQHYFVDVDNGVFVPLQLFLQHHA